MPRRAAQRWSIGRGLWPTQLYIEEANRQLGDNNYHQEQVEDKIPALQVHVPQKPQKKRVVIIFFLLVDFKNGFVSMKGCRKRGLPVGYYYFLPKIDRVLM